MSGEWSPTVKVEVQFGGSTWTDVSAYVVLADELTITHGRDSEAADPINPGSLEVSLVNDDGRFSPDVATSPYFPHVVEGVAIRASAEANGSFVPLFHGTVQAWSVSLRSATVNSCVCRVTATDMLGAFPSYVLRQAADEVIRTMAGVYYHWPMRGESLTMQSTVGVCDLTASTAEGMGGGSVLMVTEEGSDQHPLFDAASGGLQITSGTLTLPTWWAFRFVLLSAPTANCTLVEGGTFTVTWDSTNGVTATTPVGFTTAGGGPPSTWPVVVTVYVRTWVLLGVTHIQFGFTTSEADGSSASAGAAPDGSYVSPPETIQFNPVLSGGADWSAGQAAFFDYDVAPSSADYARLLLADRVPDGYDVVDLLTGFVNGPPVTGGAVGECALPLTEGRDAADVFGALATGMGARLVDDNDGTLSWLPFPPNPAGATMPAFEVDPGLTWETSDTGWYSEVTVTRADGTVYTATRPDGKRASLAIEGVHATAAADRAYANWLVGAGSSRGRLSRATYDLTTLSDSQRGTLAAITVGTRTSTTDLPAAIMPAALASIVEGIEDQISDMGWKRTFRYSPFPVFVLDDEIVGVLDSTYRLG